jgi:hypothetical protein
MSAAIDTPAPSTPSSSTGGSLSDATTPAAQSKPLEDMTWEDLRGTPAEQRQPKGMPKALEAWLATPDEDAEEGEDDGKVQAGKSEDAARPEAKSKQPGKDGAAEPEKAAAPVDEKAPRTVKMKRGKEERDVTLEQIAALTGFDVDVLSSQPDEKLQRAYQKAWHSEESTREAANQKRTVDDFFGKLIGDPMNALEAIVDSANIGVDFKQQALKYVADKQAEEALPQAERKLRALERKIAKQEAHTKAVLAQQEQEAETKRVETFWSNLNTSISGVLAEHKLPEFARGLIMAQLEDEKRTRGDQYQRMTGPDDMRTRATAHAQKIRAELRKSVGQLYPHTDGAALDEFMADHPEFFHALGEKRVAIYRQNSRRQTQPRDTSSGEGVTPRAPKAKEAKTWDEFDRELREVLRKA